MTILATNSSLASGFPAAGDCGMQLII